MCRSGTGVLIGRILIGLSRGPATSVANRTVTKAERAELERLVFNLERHHPDWAASKVERELAQRAAVAYGNWKEDTPNVRARLRQIQRWRTGFRGGGPPARARLSYTFLWPVGERQRQVIEPAYPARTTAPKASRRIFLYNCSGEIVRELRARLGDVEVAYEPAVKPGTFAELHWTRNSTVRNELLAATEHQLLHHALEAEFAVSDGKKRASLKGVLSLDATDGWTGFRSSDRNEKEIE